MRIGLSALKPRMTREFPLCECYREFSHNHDKYPEHSRLSSKLLRKQLSDQLNSYVNLNNRGDLHRKNAVLFDSNSRTSP